MTNKPQLRLGIALWLAAMAGVVVLTLTVLPQFLLHTPQRAPQWLVLVSSLLQSGVLLALAAWAGAALSQPLGLAGAPAIAAALSGSGIWAAFKPQLIPAVVTGLLAGLGLLALQHLAPDALHDLAIIYTIPIAAKLLYGGITEEVLMRWGLMTVLIWLAWRPVRKNAAPARPAYIVGGIVVAAVLFGAGHLPAVAAMGVVIDAPVIAYVILGNALPAMLFGYLYWRRGIEAAMLAHALAHAVAVLAGPA